MSITSPPRRTSSGAVEVNAAEDAKRLANDAKEAIMEDGTRDLVQYVLMLIGTLSVLKFFLQSMSALLLLVGPIGYVYLLQTCPSEESFEAKKELKRVMRGTHLADDHPDKPKGTLEQWTARLRASFTTELATFPGYQQEMRNFGGAFILTKLVVPATNLEYYWLGALGRWRYVYSQELKPTKID